MQGLLAKVLLAGQLATLAPPAVPAGPAGNPADDSGACLAAAATAEQRWGLPDHLLAAIGVVESGRQDDASGSTRPWPWTIDVQGVDHVFGSARAAGAAVAALRAAGASSIDVGCFQVNLLAHPGAFASIDAGFEPPTNADYAARLLRGLFDRSGSWEQAIGDYHSAVPERGGPYRERVLRAWHRLPRPAGAAIAEPETADPHVIRLSPTVIAVPVYSPETLPTALRAVLLAGRDIQR